MSKKKYIGYFIDHSFDELSHRSPDPIKLIENLIV